MAEGLIRYFNAIAESDGSKSRWLAFMAIMSAAETVADRRLAEGILGSVSVADYAREAGLCGHGCTPIPATGRQAVPWWQESGAIDYRGASTLKKIRG